MFIQSTFNFDFDKRQKNCTLHVDRDNSQRLHVGKHEKPKFDCNTHYMRWRFIYLINMIQTGRFT